MSGTIGEERWQPVLLVLNKRLECGCGALATIIMGKISDDQEKYCDLTDLDAWCQDCFNKAADKEWERIKHEWHDS